VAFHLVLHKQILHHKLGDRPLDLLVEVNHLDHLLVAFHLVHHKQILHHKQEDRPLDLLVEVNHLDHQLEDLLLDLHNQMLYHKLGDHQVDRLALLKEEEWLLLLHRVEAAQELQHLQAEEQQVLQLQ